MKAPVVLAGLWATGAWGGEEEVDEAPNRSTLRV
jgi:hypothetical protein